jgi:hypothetical protein
MAILAVHRFMEAAPLLQMRQVRQQMRQVWGIPY